MNDSKKLQLATAWRWLEFVALFMGGPLLLRAGYLPGHKIIWLALAMLGCLVWLMVSERVRFAGFLHMGADRDGAGLRGMALQGMALRIALVAASVLLLVLAFEPEQLFSFPRRRPLLWLVVVALYPLLSAFPQELIYRGFFFKRYSALFPTGVSMVLASAGAFAWLHVIYDNAPAMFLSLVGGLVFAQTYRNSRSLFWTSVEHAAYGLLVFSIGLGHYFYNGPR